VENLKTQIAKDDFHLSVGFVGMPYLLTQLTEEGLGNLAWKIATQDTYPGWFDMIFNKKNTAFMESWDGGYVQMPTMAGPIGAWFYRSLGGIRPDQPGFKTFVIQPYTETLDWVKCCYESPYGQIVSNWKKESGSFKWDISVPVNTTATIYIPAKSKMDVTEGGLPLDKVIGVEFLRIENGKAVLKIESGKFQFSSKIFQ
jgi:alpha-L-rhamnosidase